MKKKTTAFILLSALLLACSTCLAKECRLSEKQIDAYLDGIEQALPSLQKQAETITGLLQNTTDRAALQKELQGLRDYQDPPGTLTFLYGELKPIKPHRDYILRGRSYVPVYTLEILHDLVNGGCYDNASYDKALLTTTPEEWQRIAALMDSILSILNPLNEEIVRQLPAGETSGIEEWRCETSGPMLIPFSSCLYSVMFDINDVIAESNSPLRYYSSERKMERIKTIMAEVGTPPVHLQMMKKYFAYLSERRGNGGWENNIAAINEMLHDMGDQRDLIAGHTVQN